MKQKRCDSHYYYKIKIELQNEQIQNKLLMCTVLVYSKLTLSTVQ